MSAVSVGLKDLLLTGKVVRKKRSQSTRNDWQSDDIIRCSKTLQIEAFIRLTFCLLFSTNWNHAWVHDVEGT